MGWETIGQGLGAIAIVLFPNWWWGKGSHALALLAIRDKLRRLAASADGPAAGVGDAERLMARVLPPLVFSRGLNEIRDLVNFIQQQDNGGRSYNPGLDACLASLKKGYWKNLPGGSSELLSQAICPKCGEHLETVRGTRIEGNKAVIRAFCRRCVCVYSVWYTHAT